MPAARVRTRAPAKAVVMNQGLMIARSMCWKAATKVRSSVWRKPGMIVCAKTAKTPAMRPIVIVAPISVAVRSRGLVTGAPDAGLRGFASVVGKVAGRAAERSFDPVAERRVAAIQDGGKQVGDQRHLVPAQPGRGEPGGELLRRDRGEPDRPRRRAGNLLDRIVERQQPRPGELVELAGVAIVDQRFGGDLGDVVAVDEWLGHGID